MSVLISRDVFFIFSDTWYYGMINYVKQTFIGEISENCPSLKLTSSSDSEVINWAVSKQAFPPKCFKSCENEKTGDPCFKEVLRKFWHFYLIRIEPAVKLYLSRIAKYQFEQFI